MQQLLHVTAFVSSCNQKARDFMEQQQKKGDPKERKKRKIGKCSRGLSNI